MFRSTIHILRQWIWPAILIAVVATGLLTHNRWLPATTSQVQATIALFRSGTELSHGHGHGQESDTHDDNSGHDHAAHAGHDDSSSLELSDQAMRNIGLSQESIRPVRLEVFRKSITVPAVVAEKPGRTRVQVSTPMTGAITHVHVVEGEAVDPGTLLFRIRLTHEDLVKAQTGFVQTLGELDVERQEIARLKEIAEGVIAGKLLLDRQYAAGKLSALLQAQKEALRLHGLSDQQVARIVKSRRLLRELQMFAPSSDDHPDDELKLSGKSVQPVGFLPSNDSHANGAEAGETHPTAPLVLQSLKVHKGQSVNAGDTLCVLTDFSELYIEGQAFEYDIAALRQASRNGWKVDAVLEQSESSSRVVEGLEIVYLANEVDRESRTLHFYVQLPNRVVSDRETGEHRFVEWQYFPGQRLQLRIPVEEWPDRIVLPVDAVARDGAEFFVFQQNGSHFDRVSVHVEYRDQHSVVIANNGALFPGDAVATQGAHQMQMALKNKAGGAPDPHAGHSH